MQGLMGRYLLSAEGADPELAQAMEDFYRPRFAGDSLPVSPLGTVLALAERLDTLVAIFAVGDAPTGDRDPFALRRAAVGVLRILRDKQLRLPLWAVLRSADSRLQPDLRKDENVAEVYAFVLDRLKRIYLDEGVSASVFNAVHAVAPASIFESISGWRQSRNFWRGRRRARWRRPISEPATFCARPKSRSRTGW